jgi:uncharacterized repeat protein (TIGR03803 family)
MSLSDRLIRRSGYHASSAWKETVLYSFTGGSDGANPRGNLIADMEGTLYGTTFAGGGKSSGTVFKLTPPAKGQTVWKETVLYSFLCAVKLRRR